MLVTAKLWKRRKEAVPLALWKPEKTEKTERNQLVSTSSTNSPLHHIPVSRGLFL